MGNYPKLNFKNLKKIGVVHARWSMKWSMDGVHRVVHGKVQGVVHGPGVSVFNSPWEPCT